MRAWRTTTGFLVDLGPTSSPVISTLVAELPEGPWRELHEFVALDAGGPLREQFRVSVWSLDDDLGISTHAVIDGELRTLTVVVSHSGRIRRDERTIVSGLEEVSDQKFVRAALARHEAGEKKAIDRRNAEAAARIAAIPGAEEDFHLGESFRRAQVLLLDRIKSYGDELSAELLETLAAFGRIHRTSGGDIALSTALDAFVIACRLAAFDATIPVMSTRLGVKPRSYPDLEARLIRLERRLLAAAEGQELADALLNAAAYRQAAAQVAWARSTVGPPPIR
jgi:hypothetical protein